MLEAGEDAPGEARDVIERFAAALPFDVRERAQLLISEIVTNAVLHAPAPTVDIEAWILRGSLDVVVWDGGPGFDATPRVVGHDDGSGWGLIFVDMLSEAWATGGPGSPWVWFHLESREQIAAAEPGGAGDPLRERISALVDVRLLLESVKDYAIFGVDPAGNVTIWNAGAERITGLRADEIVGSPFQPLFEDPGGEDIGGDLEAAVLKGRQARECWLRRKDGSQVWADIVVTPTYDQKGALRGFACVARDVTWRKHLDSDRTAFLTHIQSLAATDELTGMPNRRRWQEELDREMARARRKGAPLCVAILDLDDFKAYNDAGGHQAGDRLLKLAGKAWSQGLRATDMLARYGGDEFALLLPDCPLDEAFRVVERMRSGTPGGATASVGVAYTEGSEEAEALVARADSALFEAKRRGRNAVVAV
jgi:diguanylate cyclase (GGDEF)-like protein/PAS domain S-box-containing protein